VALTEGDKCAETNHADPRCDALIAPKRGLERSRLPTGAAKVTTSKSASVFNTTETNPSTRNWPTTCPRCGLTNCGKNERRKSAVFGLSISVRTSCRKMFSWGTKNRHEIERLVSGTNHPKANPDQVSCPGALDDAKCRCRSDQQSGKAEGCGKNVNKATEERAQGRENSLAATA